MKMTKLIFAVREKNICFVFIPNPSQGKNTQSYLLLV